MSAVRGAQNSLNSDDNGFYLDKMLAILPCISDAKKIPLAQFHCMSGFHGP
jgi:hypothetical protein